MPCQRRLIGTTSGASDRSSVDTACNIGSMGKALGALAGITAWLGWLTVCPALGFPSLATAAMLNLVVVPRQDPGFWLGWALLVLGLAVLALMFLVLVGRGRLRPGIATGAAYGVVCWLIAGVVVMPLLGLAVTPAAPGAAVDAMRGSFLMIDPGGGGPPPPPPPPGAGSLSLLVPW